MSKNKTFSDTSANRYSLALYELANENGKLEEIEKNSSFFTSLISNNEELKLLIKNPTVKKEDLQSIILKMAEQFKLNDLMTKFLGFLVSKRRFFFVEKNSSSLST